MPTREIKSDLRWKDLPNPQRIVHEDKRIAPKISVNSSVHRLKDNITVHRTASTLYDPSHRLPGGYFHEQEVAWHRYINEAASIAPEREWAELVVTTPVDEILFQSLQMILEDISPELHDEVLVYTMGLINHRDSHLLIKRDEVVLLNKEDNDKIFSMKITPDGMRLNPSYTDSPYPVDHSNEFIGKDHRLYLPQLENPRPSIQTTIAIIEPEHIPGLPYSIGIFGGLHFDASRDRQGKIDYKKVLANINGDFFTDVIYQAIQNDQIHPKLPSTVSSFYEVLPLPDRRRK